uniref:Uncharacterized protein n=1 Tax=Arundo donax TaxID=35708 RepID=A0A0A9HR05_ARUDO
MRIGVVVSVAGGGAGRHGEGLRLERLQLLLE